MLRRTSKAPRTHLGVQSGSALRIPVNLRAARFPSQSLSSATTGKAIRRDQLTQEWIHPFSIVWQGDIGRTWWVSRETPLPIPPPARFLAEGGGDALARPSSCASRPAGRAETPPSPPREERVGACPAVASERRRKRRPLARWQRVLGLAHRRKAGLPWVGPSSRGAPCF